MKYINYIFLFIFTILQYTAFSQVESTPTLVGKVFVTQTGGGAGYWQVTGNFTDESGFYDGSTIGVGTVLFFNDAGIGYYLPVTNVVSLTPPSFTVQVNNTGIIGIVGIPTTTGSMFNPSPTLKLPFFTSGLSNADQQLLLNYLVNRIESQLATADEIAFVSGTGIPATTVATVLGYKLAKNNGGDGVLYEWDGTQWVENQRSASLVYDFETSPTVTINAVGTTVDAVVNNNSLDSNYIKDNSLPLDKISQSNATIGQAPVWDGTKWTAQNIAGSVKIDVVRDSAEMRNYNGTGEVLFMTNNAKGGYFKPCTVCTADQFMVFTDALTRKWERFGYEQVMASWFMSTPNDTLNHLDLQRGLDYVMSKTPTNRLDQTKGTLWLNRNARLRNTVTRPEGANLRGYSPARAVRGNFALEAPPSNIIYVDLRDATKTALTTEENIRGYEVAGGLSDLVFYVVSRCSIVVDYREPYRSHIDHLFIASDSVSNFNSRKFDYGLAVKGSVYTVADGVYIAGARKAGIYGYAGDPCVDFGGGTFLVKNSSVIRSKIGIQSQRRDSICSGSPSNTYQVFELDNFVLENIDSIGAYLESNVHWSNSYAENVPLDSLGYFLYITPKGAQDGSFVLNNVSPNAAATCDSCKVFNRGARYLEFTGAFINNYATILDSVYTNDNVVFNNVRYLGVDFPLRNLDKPNVKAEMLYAYTGSGVATSINWLNQKYRIKAIEDKNGSTGGAGQYIKADTGDDWLWSEIDPFTIGSGGAVDGQVLIYDGEGWIPGDLPTGGSVPIPSNEIPYGNGTSITSEPALRYDPANNRLGVNAGTAPQAAGHFVSGAALEKALIATNSAATQGIEVNRDGNLTATGSNSANVSITAGITGGYNLNFGVWKMYATGTGSGSRIFYETDRVRGHIFKHFALPSSTNTVFDTTSNNWVWSTMRTEDVVSMDRGNAAYWGWIASGEVRQTGTATGQTGGILIPSTFALNARDFNAIRLENNKGRGINQTISDVGNSNALSNSFMAKMAVGKITPVLKFEVHSERDSTFGIAKLQNLQDSVTFFLGRGTPQSAVTSRIGNVYYGSNGTLWQKLTGTGNTGWGQFYNLGLSHGATNGQVMKYNGTAWVASNDLNTTYTGGTGIDVTGTVISNTGTASTTPNTPAGNIASTTVQGALNEVDAEKNVNIQFQEDGTNLGTPGNVSVVNFVGSNVTATRVGNTVDVTVTGGSGGTPGGTNTQLQFNNSGAFGGTAATWSTTDTLLALQNSRFRIGTTTRLFQGLHPVPAGIVYNSTNRAGLVITDNVAEGVRPTSLMLSGNLNSTNRLSLMYLQPTGIALAPGKTTGVGFNIISMGNAYYAQPITVTSGTVTASSLGYYANQYWQNTGGSLTANGEYTNYGSGGQIATTGVTVGTHSDFRTDGIAGSTNGVITNRYNFHITSTQSTVGGQGVTNNWGVFQTDLNSKNAFGGRTMFGATTNPLATVHIRGINAIGDSTSFLVENSAGVSSAWASNNGNFNAGSRSGNRWTFTSSGVSFTNGSTNQNLTFNAGIINFPSSNINITGTVTSSNIINTTRAYFGGNSSPLASWVHLAAGTTNNAPLRFTLGGAFLSTPIGGIVEADNTRLYYTNSSAVRKSIAHLDDITATTFNNTSSAVGLSVNNGAINLHAADATNPGAVSTGSQTFGGPKTFKTDVDGSSFNIILENGLANTTGEGVALTATNNITQLGEDTWEIVNDANTTIRKSTVKSVSGLTTMQSLNGATRTVESYGWQLDGGLNIGTGITIDATSVANRDGRYIFSGAGSILELPAPSTVAVGTSFEWVVTFITGTNAKIQNVAAGTDTNFVVTGTSGATSFVDLPSGRSAGKVTCMAFGGVARWFLTVYN